MVHKKIKTKIIKVDNRIFKTKIIKIETATGIQYLAVTIMTTNKTGITQIETKITTRHRITGHKTTTGFRIIMETSPNFHLYRHHSHSSNQINRIYKGHHQHKFNQIKPHFPKIEMKVFHNHHHIPRSRMLTHTATIYR